MVTQGLGWVPQARLRTVRASAEKYHKYFAAMSTFIDITMLTRKYVLGRGETQYTNTGIGISVPDPKVFGPPGSGSFHQAKIERKTLISTVFWLLYHFWSLKNDVNVPSKCNKQKNPRFFVSWRLIDQDPDPDPLVRGTDPRIQIQIHTKMSRIRNTDRCSIKRTHWKSRNKGLLKAQIETRKFYITSFFGPIKILLLTPLCLHA